MSDNKNGFNPPKGKKDDKGFLGNITTEAELNALAPIEYDWIYLPQNITLPLGIVMEAGSYYYSGTGWLMLKLDAITPIEGASGYHRVEVDNDTYTIATTDTPVSLGWDLTQYQESYLEFEFSDAGARAWSTGKLRTAKVIERWNAGDIVDGFLHMYADDYVIINLVDPTTGTFAIRWVGRNMNLTHTELFVIAPNADPLIEVQNVVPSATTANYQNFGDANDLFTGRTGDVVTIVYGDNRQDSATLFNGVGEIERAGQTTYAMAVQVVNGQVQIKSTETGNSGISEIWYRRHLDAGVINHNPNVDVNRARWNIVAPNTTNQGAGDTIFLWQTVSRTHHSNRVVNNDDGTFTITTKENPIKFTAAAKTTGVTGTTNRVFYIKETGVANGTRYAGSTDGVFGGAVPDVSAIATIPENTTVTLEVRSVSSAENQRLNTNAYVEFRELFSDEIKRVASSDNAIVRFDGTTGEVQDSSSTIDDNGNLFVDGNITADNLGVERAPNGGLFRSGRDESLFGDVGLNAVDLGHSNTTSSTIGATGIYSKIGGGVNNTASGINSSILNGGSNEASGNFSSILNGGSNEASGNFSSILNGSGNEAKALFSTVFNGQRNTAQSFAEIVGGMFGTLYTAVSEIAWEDADRLFNLGGGTSGSDRIDIFTILKSGKTGIGFDNFETTNDDELLQVNGGAKVDDLVIQTAIAPTAEDLWQATDNVGNGKWFNPFQSNDIITKEVQEQTTNIEATYQSVTRTLIAGTYSITSLPKYRCSNVAQDYIGRLYIDGVIQDDIQAETKDAGANQKHTSTLHSGLTLTADTIVTIEYRYLSSSAFVTAFTRKNEIIIKRIK